MPVTHSSQIETAIARLAQTAYGTPRTSGDDWRRIISDSVNVANKGLGMEDDAAYDNGSDLAVETWATTAETSIDISPKLNFQDIGIQLHRAMGAVSTSGPDGGLYTHVFTPQSMNTSRQMPASTFLKKYGGLRTELLPDMVSASLSISGGKSGRLNTAQSFIGSGNYTKNPSGYVSPPIVDDREYAYGGQATIRLSQAGVGTRQIETVIGVGTATASGNVNVTVTAAGLAGSPLLIPVAIASGDTATVWAGKVRTALRANVAVNTMFEVTGVTTDIVFTRRVKAANDATLNIAIAANGTGITDVPVSTNYTAGVAGVSMDYTCLLESWSLNINNPAADDGYRQCSPYVVAGNPMSGQIRYEHLVGIREFSFNFSARDSGTDSTEDWLRAGTIVDLEIPILGVESNDFSLRIQHTRGRVVQANPITGAGGDFIGVDGVVRLLASSAGDGTIPFSAVLVNATPSYTS